MLLVEDCISTGCNSSEETTTPDGFPTLLDEDWLESEGLAGYKVWQVMFLGCAGFMTFVIMLCCCIRFRIPRTKQEIEADYVRKKITKKFKKQLQMIQNSDMDEMDLKRALDRIRAEFRSDTESLAQSDALSGATLSSGNFHLPGDVDKNHVHTYRKASDLGLSFEELMEKGQPRRGRFSFSGVFNKLKPTLNTKPQEVLE